MYQHKSKQKSIGDNQTSFHMSLPSWVIEVLEKDNIADVQAGAGIVADSVPANEWQETLNKAKGMLKAIDLAEEGLS